VRKLGQFAYRRRRGLTIVAGLVAVVSALGGASVFNNVKPFGFQDPASQSSKAYDAIEDATGQRAVPDVELLVQPSSGNPVDAAAPVAARLRTVPGVNRVVTPSVDPRLVSTDGRAALVVGFVSSDVTDLSQVGSDVTKRFGGSGGCGVVGSALAVR
jgi:hypothetical protein